MSSEDDSKGNSNKNRAHRHFATWTKLYHSEQKKLAEERNNFDVYEGYFGNSRKYVKSQEKVIARMQRAAKFLDREEAAKYSQQYVGTFDKSAEESLGAGADSAACSASNKRKQHTSKEAKSKKSKTATEKTADAKKLFRAAEALGQAIAVAEDRSADSKSAQTYPVPSPQLISQYEKWENRHRLSWWGFVKRYYMYNFQTYDLTSMDKVVDDLYKVYGKARSAEKRNVWNKLENVAGQKTDLKSRAFASHFTLEQVQLFFKAHEKSHAASVTSKTERTDVKTTGEGADVTPAQWSGVKKTMLDYFKKAIHEEELAAEEEADEDDADVVCEDVAREMLNIDSDSVGSISSEEEATAEEEDAAEFFASGSLDTLD